MTDPRTSARFPESVDVAIVGSGPTGAAYARILSELRPDAIVAVFEAGPVISDPPGQHVKNIVDPTARLTAQRNSEGARPHTSLTAGPTARDPAKRVVRAGTHLLPEGFQQPGEDGLPALAMSTNVGGMGAHWTCACPRPGGAERVSFLSDFEDLLDEAERLLAVDRHPFDGAPFADVVRARLESAFDDGRPDGRRVGPMPLAVHRNADGSLHWSGSDVVFGDVTRNSPYFSLIAEALVIRVLLEDGRAAGIVVRDRRTGGEHQVRARFVVVAADAVRTPQLLWASGVRLPALGRYLNDQPQVIFATRLRDVSAAPSTDHESSRQTAIVEQSGVSWVPYTDEQPFHGQVMQLDASPIPLVGDDEPARGSIVGLGWFCAKDVQPSDRIEFDETNTDENGLPQPIVHYRLTARDRASMARAAEVVTRVARELGEPIGDQPMMLVPGASLHYQGTTRMGVVDDGTSVCGLDSAVWGVRGLYVAGNGVIPTSMACNPTLTSVALAVRGARSIAHALPTTTTAGSSGALSSKASV